MTGAGIETVISDVGRQYLALHLTSDVGPVRLRNLLDRFGAIDAVLDASMAELQHAEGIGPRTAEAIFRARSDDAVDREIEQAASLGVRIVCGEDADFPAPLRNITDPPICLYITGTLEPTDAVGIAVVGTRRCSHYGREQARRFGEMLAGAGFTIVSGLARGIDGEAHHGALQAGGRTVAVLGHGLSTIYPAEHAALADRVTSSGALVSEYPLGASPEAGNFPRRNRIITGLSLGVIVVEAGKRSGALITARLAHDYNREVFAIPGRVDRPQDTAGVHALIRDGQAKLVTCLEDVLDELGEVGEIMGRFDTRERPQRPSATKDPPPLADFSADENAVLNAVRDGAEEVDSILSRTGLDSAKTLSALTSLRLKGAIRQEPGHRFAARSSSR